MKTTSSAMKAQKEERIRKYSEDRSAVVNFKPYFLKFLFLIII